MVGKRVHWEVCRKFGVDVNKNWYEHEPEAVIENNQCKILWDFESSNRSCDQGTKT